jgi:hypothetical protein
MTLLTSKISTFVRCKVQLSLIDYYQQVQYLYDMRLIPKSHSKHHYIVYRWVGPDRHDWVCKHENSSISINIIFTETDFEKHHARFFFFICGVDDAVNAVTNSANAAISSLPSLMLQRALPGVYDMFQEYKLDAETEIDLQHLRYW